MTVIVSLTTTRSRMHLLKYTLASLLDQEYKADRILVNISREAYLLDEGIPEQPSWLEAMAGRGVEVHWVANTGPYRKLLPALEQAREEDLVITCDDDVIYGPGWLGSLLEAAQGHPDSVVCGRPVGRYGMFLANCRVISTGPWPLRAQRAGIWCP